MCPSCRAPSALAAVSDLPINFVAADLAHQHLQKQKRFLCCQLHPTEVLRFFCNNCNTGICAECIIAHSGHFFVKYDESVQVLKNKSSEIMRNINGVLAVFDEKEREIGESMRKLESKAAAEVAKIDSEFDTLQVALDERKTALILQFNRIVAIEEEKISREIQKIAFNEEELAQQKRTLAVFTAELQTMNDSDVAKRSLSLVFGEFGEQMHVSECRVQMEVNFQLSPPEFVVPVRPYQSQIDSIGKVLIDSTDLYEIQQPLLCFFGDKNQVMTFDLTTKQWDLRTLFSQYEFNYYAAAVTLPDGSALITGGGSSSTVLHYKDRKATKKASMSQVRKEHASVFLCGFVYVIGGYDGQTGHFLQEGEKYSPTQDEWTAIAPMNVARCAFSATAVNSKLIYIFGGYDGSMRLSSIEKYDPEEDRWMLLPVTLKSPLSNSACFSPKKNQVIVLGGGLSTGFSLCVQLLNIEDGKWLALPPMTEGRDLRNKVCYYDSKVYCVGGYNFKAEVLNLATEEWDQLPNYLVGDNLDSWSCALLFRRCEKKQ